MRVVVVYESLFGSTRQIAEAIAQGFREASPDAEVRCVRVADTPADVVAGAELLVVGGPTHMRGMTSGVSRKLGLDGEKKKGGDYHPEPDALGPGVRDWFHNLPKAAKGSRAAAFDTRVPARLAGGAAHGIARQLRRHGYQLAAEPEGFIVDDTEGPLQDGERARATAWAAGLVRQPAS